LKEASALIEAEFDYVTDMHAYIENEFFSKGGVVARGIAPYK